jgi:hypothetical protein
VHRKLKLAAYAVPAALTAIAAFWFLIAGPAVNAAHISSGYVAKSICSCVFVDERNLAACRADLAPGYGSMRVKLDRDDQFVRANAGIISSDVARFEPPYGCRLDER